MYDVEFEDTLARRPTTNAMEIAKYGVFGTPTVVDDGEVKRIGKIPTKDGIKRGIKKNKQTRC